MEYYVVASGSKGNCCVVKDDKTTVVIDCGTTKTYLTRSFHTINLEYQSVDALLVTHDHSDHISQIKMFQNVPIYAPMDIAGVAINKIVPFTTTQIGTLQVTPIPLSHDCDIIVGYVIENEMAKFVYVTDTGYFSNENQKYIANADYYVFESNHDPELLMQSKRPYYVKQRILSSTGHLCNEEAATVLASVVTTRSKEIVLAHISEDANDHELAIAVTKERLNGLNVKVSAAKQFEILKGGVYE